MKVKNVIKDPVLKCGCDSWLDHWKTNAPVQRENIVCSFSNCNRKAVVGGHVADCDSSGRHWFVVPLCSSHNLPTLPCFNINKEAYLISSKPTMLCHLSSDKPTDD